MATRVSFAPQTTGNLFLDALPAASANRLIPLLEKLTVTRGHVIVAAGTAPQYVTFPLHSVISVVSTTADGVTVEVGLIGRDGLSEVSVVLGDDQSPNDVMVQIPDGILRMDTRAFLEIVRDDPQLKDRLLRYAQVVYLSTAQSSLCNRLHPINERCARWLLMAHDRVDGDEVLLTQEYLATMLGVRRRPSVTLAASALEHGGFIAYKRGRITIRDRAGLENVACECYAYVNRQFERLLGYSPRKVPVAP
jgi:CRP-like cAMP-binding protein